MEMFQLLCNWIVLISAVLIAIKSIADMLGKPIKFVRKKTNDDFTDKVISILNNVLPDILVKHDLETRKKYLADREAYLEDIKREVIKEVGGQLNQVTNLSSQYRSLEISAKDVLREKIVCLYENNKDRKKLRFFERHALEQYYKDYKAMHGNTYIETLYERMKTWETEPDDYQ